MEGSGQTLQWHPASLQRRGAGTLGCLQTGCACTGLGALDFSSFLYNASARRGNPVAASAAAGAWPLQQEVVSHGHLNQDRLALCHLAEIHIA